jgi:predicted ATPase
MPSGVVTFLFTDIEGSTRRWESDADAMRAALAAHDRVLRQAIEAHGGFMFKHTGDGMCAAFASPRAAVDAAIDAQRALELPVRMGIATGEADLRDGDYFGTVLNRVARLMAAGHGGQVLVAESTAGLVSDVELVSLGSRRLRDVANPITIHQLQAPGLRAEFPPLRTLDGVPGNLRPSVTGLFGREKQVADTEVAVRSHRVVTVTGVGGVGKTRLAVEVATRLAAEFPDGVWLFELAAVTDEAAVPDAVASVLGITQQPGKTMTESVASALEGRVRLLVFDNCEHLLEASGYLMDRIVAECPTVKILATSRQGLGVADEQICAVPALDRRPAVDLFVARAASIGSTVDPNDAAAHEICRRLDGIPLAIELAASRMASMSTAEIRDRLDDRFKLLVGSRRNLERHQTLRHAVAWSHDLLGDDEKLLLARCSVFAGGFDLSSASVIAELADEYETLAHLDALVRKSLINVDRSSGHTRYSMLETIRQYAEEQLLAGGRADHTRMRHARLYAHRETDILSLWDGPRQRESYEWYAAELPNLRVAFRCAADAGDVDLAANVVILAGFLGIWVESYEPASWAEELLEVVSEAGHPRLASLYLAASMCNFAGRVQDAIRFLEAAHSVLRTEGESSSVEMIGPLGGAYLAVGRPDAWVELCRARLAEAPDRHAFTAGSLAMALRSNNEEDEAVAAVDGLIEIAEATGNPAALSYALIAYGAALQEADPPRSLMAVRRGMRVAQASGVRANESILAMSLCKYETDHGEPIAALDGAEVAIRNYHDSGNVAVMCVPLANLAYLLGRLGQHGPAATILGYGFTPMVAVTIPGMDQSIAALREVLGAETYEELAARGKAMSLSEIVAFAYDQIEQARAQLEPST